MEVKKYSNVVKSGRAFNGAHRDAGIIVHIIEGEDKKNGFWGGKSLCRTEPGYSGNGWATSQRDATCYKCIKKYLNLTDNGSEN
jgi:hypothetical protein